MENRAQLDKSNMCVGGSPSPRREMLTKRYARLAFLLDGSIFRQTRSALSPYRGWPTPLARVGSMVGQVVKKSSWNCSSWLRWWCTGSSPRKQRENFGPDIAEELAADFFAEELR